MILQLAPSVPLETPAGKGMAILVHDEGQEHDLLWTVIVDETRELWTFRNRDVKAQENITFGRVKQSA